MTKNLSSKVLLFCLFAFSTLSLAQTPKKVLLQGFWWDFRNTNYPQGWSNYLVDLAPRLRELGIDAVWVPVNVKNANPNSVGYMPFDHYDLGDKFQKNNLKTPFGDKDEFLRMVGVLHANGIDVIQDIVLNHVGEAGSASGQGGLDPAPQSVATAGGYKNFRYTSFATPALNESADDYWTRNGRWPKNYQNFHSCTANCNDINGTFWGPDIDFSANAIGRSSNIPTSGSATISGVTRSYFNPVQPTNYMRNQGRDWMIWLKKQTGVDGFRLDAVKHFPVAVQEDYIANLQMNAGFASGGDNMFTVGEWVGGRNELDAYVDNMQGRAGTFDFGLRGFPGTPGLYGMVYGMGNYDMSNIPAAQQQRRDRTVPFVNNHDTFRPTQPAQGSQGLQPNGNYPVNAQGNPVRWSSNSELSPNIDPREPRLAAAYAIICAVDGNPQIFFEDLFDVGTTGKRYTHMPNNPDDLPVRAPIANIIRCHQKFGFKQGAYRVRTAESSVFFEAGSSAADLLIFERSGRAIIGVNDNFNAVQTAWIDTDFPVGTVLKDYSGNFPNVTVTTRMNGPGGRVRIQVPPCNGTGNNTLNKGYAIYAPASLESVFNAPFNPTQRETQQEWEMANDLGDSHVRSLRQGGALPANSTAWREVGKVFAEQGKTITYRLYPSFTNANHLIGLYLGDQCGNVLDSIVGTGNLTKTFTPTTTGWYRFKVRNRSTANPEQRVWVNISYTSPRNVNALQTRSFPDPIVNLGPDRNGCLGSNINLNIVIDANHTYQWTNLQGEVLATTSNISINQPGTYIATATNTITGCSARDTIRINNFFAPPALPEVIRSNDTLYVVNPLPGYSYRWRVNGIFAPGDTLTYLVIPANAENIALRVISPEGCGTLSTNLLVSIAELISGRQQFRIYPNPSKRYLNVQVPENELVQSIAVYNVNGKSLLNVQPHSPLNNLTMDMADLPSGIYYIKIVGQSSTEVHKFYKQP